jgi:hypothetical protein
MRWSGRSLFAACVIACVGCGSDEIKKKPPVSSGGLGGIGGGVAGGGQGGGLGGAGGGGGIIGGMVGPDAGRDAARDGAITSGPDAAVALPDAGPPRDSASPTPDASVTTPDAPLVVDMAVAQPDSPVVPNPDVAVDMAVVTPDAFVPVADTAAPDVAADSSPDTSPDTAPDAFVHLDTQPDVTPSPDTTPDADISPFCTPSGSRPALKKTLIVDGLALPMEITAPPDEADTLWVLEHRSGRVRVIKNGAITGTLVQVTVPPAGIPNRQTKEEGLYSIALHPDYATNKLFYLFYSANDGPDYSTTVDEFVKNGTTATRVRNVYSKPSNHYFHNGGAIAFHPNDQQLYISVGDNRQSARAQDQEGDWGRILRINMSTKAGTTLHYGLRNPWRISFDPLNGDLYIGDVGESGSTSEKVFYSAAGSPKTNFQWGGTGSRPTALDQTDAQHPIIGGHVYRGKNMPGLCGYYVYGRHSDGFIKTLKVVNGAATQVANSAITTDDLSSLGVDAKGELYFSQLGGEVYRIDPQ